MQTNKHPDIHTDNTTKHNKNLNKQRAAINTIRQAHIQTYRNTNNNTITQTYREKDTQANKG